MDVATPGEQAFARRVADAEAAYTGAVARAGEALGAGGAGERAARMRAFRTAAAEAERAHAAALTAAAAGLQPALAANMREIEALAARDEAEGTAFTAASIERYQRLVAARARLMVAAIRPGTYARMWHDEVMPASPARARAAPPADGTPAPDGPVGGDSGANGSLEVFEMRWSILIAVGSLASVGLVACGAAPSGGNPAGTDAAAVVDRVKSGMESQAAPAQAVSAQAATVAAARDEAAKALGVPPEQATVERVEMVQWNDASLGCAEPGKPAAQVVTPGLRVVVAAAGQRREVHTDAAGRMVVCQNPSQ